tara:strand:- start:1566 stop:1943 length:378 start_codon:yes stop_codon:yes gene_type:complete
MLRLLGILMLVSGMASAHDLVPTYPEVKESHIDNIFVVKLETWNRREGIEYFEIGVFDKDFNKVRFASTEKIFQLRYLAKKKFKVYIKESDLKTAMYICTTSKNKKKLGVTRTVVSSKVCSKIGK